MIMVGFQLKLPYGFNIPLLTQSEQTPEVEPEDQKEQAEPTPAPVNNAQEDQGFHVGLWVVVAAVVVLLSCSDFYSLA